MGLGPGLGGERAQSGQERQGRVCTEATVGAGGRKAKEGGNIYIYTHTHT